MNDLRWDVRSAVSDGKPGDRPTRVLDLLGGDLPTPAPAPDPQEGLSMLLSMANGG